MHQLSEWLLRGLGIRVKPIPDDAPARPSVVVVLDLMEVSPIDLGTLCADVHIVPVEWHRRVEVLELLVRCASRFPTMQVLVLACEDDPDISAWGRRWVRSSRATERVRIRLDFG